MKPSLSSKIDGDRTVVPRLPQHRQGQAAGLGDGEPDLVQDLIRQLGPPGERNGDLPGGPDVHGSGGKTQLDQCHDQPMSVVSRHRRGDIAINGEYLRQPGDPEDFEDPLLRAHQA